MGKEDTELPVPFTENAGEARFVASTGGDSDWRHLNCHSVGSSLVV
jgi:hypothetical protein